MQVNNKHYRTLWLEGSTLKMINQPLIPHNFQIIDLKTHKDTANAISTMIVRGAGAIGASGAYGMAQAALEAPSTNPMTYIKEAAETLKNTRPTAQDLFYAIDRMMAVIEKSNIDDIKENAVKEANIIADKNAKDGEAIGEHGAKIIKDGYNILTHCNAGWLAFVDWGSALAPIYKAKRQEKKVFVYVDETRPRCQGSRLTAWELCEENIDHAIIADNASGHFLKSGKIDMVIVGSDRIAANGDVANKIGTYEKAVLAKENGIPFYVAAPSSTIDMNCLTGDDIPIEERSEDEVLYMFGYNSNNVMDKIRIAPEKSKAFNPAFDVTPAKYITGIITEDGIIEPTRLSERY